MASLRSKNEYTFTSWKSMIRRCSGKGESAKYYAEKGVKVCEHWRCFGSFLLDMGERPCGMTIDRIDNSKGYSKENCRWATTKQQNLNKTNNVIITANGMSKTISEWADHLGVGFSTIRERIVRGISHDDAINTPIIRKKRKSEITINDKTLSIVGWSNATGIHQNTIRARINAGWTGEKIIKKPRYITKNNKVD